MSQTIFIYTLKDPNTGEIRYVGKTNDPKERLRTHLKEARGLLRSDYKNNWIRSLKQEPILEVLDEVPVEHWQQWEVAWIEFFLERGFRLVNSLPGGGGILFTPEIRRKISESLKGRSRPLEVRQRVSRSLTGHKRSIESRKKQSDTLQGRTFSLETRNKISEAQRGRILSKAVREKISLALKGRIRSVESRQKQSLTLKKKAGLI